MTTPSLSLPFRHLLRVIIELTTPCLIASGNRNGFADAVYLADPNGLPALPGSSLAGVLRSAFREEIDDPEAENRLFGFPPGEKGHASRLWISWACIHDSKNRPIEGIVSPKVCFDDPVLAAAKMPILRDHVKINESGASDAEGGAKFDEEAVAAGHRFTFEIEFESNGDETAHHDWKRIIKLLDHPTLRIGGKSRRGYGAFKIISLLERTFDLRKAEDFQGYSDHPVSLSERAETLSEIPIPTGEITEQKTYLLKVKPSGYWMIGGGDFRDQRISWDEQGGASVIENCIVIPGTSIKGALAHRIAFHYNAIKGYFADTPETLKKIQEENPAIRKLFGYVDKKDDNDENDAKRGEVIIDDIYLPADTDSSAAILHHVGIDRFTGGARDSVLFNERPLWQGEEVSIKIIVTDSAVFDDQNIREAFDLTLQDFVENRLQLGAGSGRGLGYFTGRIEQNESRQIESNKR